MASPMFAAGKRCQHATSAGCGIYDERPEGCRTFRCTWLDTPELDEGMRPDRCGFILRPLHQLEAGTWGFEFTELPRGADSLQLRLAVAGLIGTFLDHRADARLHLQLAPWAQATSGRGGQVISRSRAEWQATVAELEEPNPLTVWGVLANTVVDAWGPALAPRRKAPVKPPRTKAKKRRR
ncbi:MAG: hypothetical protein R3F62_09790 [Planctomycetota bacterium]